MILEMKKKGMKWNCFNNLSRALKKLSVQSRNTQRDQHSKTLLYLNDLEREFRSRSQHLNTKVIKNFSENMAWTFYHLLFDFLYRYFYFPRTKNFQVLSSTSYHQIIRLWYSNRLVRACTSYLELDSLELVDGRRELASF